MLTDLAKKNPSRSSWSWAPDRLLGVDHRPPTRFTPGYVVVAKRWVGAVYPKGEKRWRGEVYVPHMMSDYVNLPVEGDFSSTERAARAVVNEHAKQLERFLFHEKHGVFPEFAPPSAAEKAQRDSFVDGVILRAVSKAKRLSTRKVGPEYRKMGQAVSYPELVRVDRIARKSKVPVERIIERAKALARAGDIYMLQTWDFPEHFIEKSLEGSKPTRRRVVTIGVPKGRRAPKPAPAFLVGEAGPGGEKGFFETSQPPARRRRR
jgi:hypothetical protein